MSFHKKGIAYSIIMAFFCQLMLIPFLVIFHHLFFQSGFLIKLIPKQQIETFIFSKSDYEKIQFKQGKKHPEFLHHGTMYDVLSINVSKDKNLNYTLKVVPDKWELKIAKLLSKPLQDSQSKNLHFLYWCFLFQLFSKSNTLQDFHIKNTICFLLTYHENSYSSLFTYSLLKPPCG